MKDPYNRHSVRIDPVAKHEAIAAKVHCRLAVSAVYHRGGLRKVRQLCDHRVYLVGRPHRRVARTNFQPVNLSEKLRSRPSGE